MKIVLRDGICEICFCRVNQPCVFWGICMAVFMTIEHKYRVTIELVQKNSLHKKDISLHETKSRS